ncbi:MAG TPA: ATP-binding cassette domain-containing protein [Stellaceae bacterium]|nr:ATP-binding cassette domain-containing protein [Stellaceae bacterium]
MNFVSLQDALRAQRGALAALLGFSLVLNLLLLVLPLYMMLVFDHVLTSRSGATLLVLTLMAALALVFYGVFDVLRAQILARIAAALEAGLGPTLIARSIALGRLTPSGTTAHAMRDLAALRGFFTGGAALALLDAPWAVLFAVALFILHPLLGLTGIIGALVLVAIGLAHEGAARRPAHAVQSLAARLVEWTDLVASNPAMMSGIGIISGAQREWRARSTALCAAQLDFADRSAVAVGLARGARMLIQIAILALGAYLVLQRELGAGSMVAASLLLARMLAPIESSIAAWRLVVQTRFACRRLRQLLALEVEPRPAAACVAAAGGLSVEGVSYVPSGAREALLRQISFRLEPGEALGILGPAAAGKSSLARLLVGAVPPSAGRVRLGAVDLELLRRGEDRRLGYLPQESLLLPGSVAQNIAGFADAAPDAVMQAAILAGMHEIILQLPQAYDTPVAPGGASLSGGLRRGVALAAAFLGAPPLVVLDEPTAHLDGRGREALIRALAGLREAGAIVVVISREPLVLERMDKLAILERGALANFGRRAEVLSRLGGLSPERQTLPAHPAIGHRRLA